MKIVSPYSSCLGTNYVPTDEEVPHITELLSQSRLKLESLRQQMNADSHVDIELSMLQQQHETLSKEIKQYEVLLAPIWRIPLDVLREIFLYCLPDRWINPISNMQHAPLLLTRICRSWRHIALDHAELWSSIRIQIPTKISNVRYARSGRPIQGARPTKPNYDSPGFLPVIRAAERWVQAIGVWLGRSGGRAINIWLCENYSIYPSPTQIYDVILDALIPFANRWGELICSALPASCITRIASLPASAVPRLHALSFHGMTPSRLDQDTTFWMNSPLICSPDMRNIIYDYVNEDFTRFPLPWAQLTSLSLSYYDCHRKYFTANVPMSFAALAKLLITCPLLRQCSLIFRGEHAESVGSNDISPASVPLLHLEDFTFRTARNSSVSAFLDVLNIPSMKKLAFSASRNMASPLPDFLHHNGHTLCKLTVNPKFYTPGELTTCLRLCPNLVELEFNQWSPASSDRLPPPAIYDESPISHLLYTDRLLQVLTMPDTETQTLLLPKLSKLSFHVVSSFTDTAVLDLIKTRNTQGQVKIKKAHFQFNRSQELPMLDEFKKFEQEGMSDWWLKYSIPEGVQPTVEYPDPLNFDGLSRKERDSYTTDASF